MEFVSLLWNQGILKPMVNSLVVLYVFLFHNFGLSIIVFTLVIRLVTMPLTLRQLHQTKSMSQLQPKIQDLQKRYAKDRQKLSQETMRLYKEQGVNPVGCLGPMLIQFPIWIGLYQALVIALPSSPESLVGLAQRLYPWLSLAHEAVPFSHTFLWFDLSLPDKTPLLPVLVGASMWVQQKMTTLPTTDPRQQQTNQMMLWMMPIMFTFFTFSFPSGLAVYWVVSNIAGIVIQYFVTGWGSLLPLWKPRQAIAPAPDQPPAALPPDQPGKERIRDGKRRDKRQNPGRGDRTGPEADERRSGGGGD